MIIKSITLDNFMSHKHTSVDLQGTHIFVGPNGAGKSSIADAILYALWGVSRADTDSIIRRGETKASVTITFFIDNNEYTVTRSRHRGRRTTLTVEKNGIDVTKTTIQLTQQYINGVIGLTRDEFLSTICIRQGDASRFTSMTPAQQKEMIMRMLRIDELSQVEQKARDHAARKKEEEIRIRSAIDTMKSFECNVTEDDILKARKELKRLHNELDRAMKTSSNSAKRRELQEKISVLQSMKYGDMPLEMIEEAIARNEGFIASHMLYIALEEIKNMNKEIEMQSRVLAEATEERDTARANAQKTSDEIETLTSQYNELTAKSSSMKKEIAILEKQVEKREKDLTTIIRDRVCPTCLASGDEIHNAEKRIRAEIANLRQRISAIEDDLSNIGHEMNRIHSEIETRKSKIRKMLHDIERADGEIRKAEITISSLRTKIDSAKEKARKYEGHEPAKCDIDAITQEIEDLKHAYTAIDKHGEMRNLVMELENTPPSEDITKIRTMVSEAEARVAEMETMLREWKEKERLVSENMTMLSDVATKRKQFEILARAAGKNGAQAILIDSALPAIEDETNNILKNLLPGSSIIIRTQREKKSGGTTETFSINLWRDGVEFPVSTLSGGERFRVDLALRLALGNIASGGKIKTSIIDEGFGSQDIDGVENITSILEGLDIETLVVITHIEAAVAQMAKNSTIHRVIKVGNISHVEERW